MARRPESRGESCFQPPAFGPRAPCSCCAMPRPLSTRCPQGFFACGAKLCKAAALAIRPARRAHCAPVQHAAVAEIVRFLRRQHLHKGLFHLHRVFGVLHKAQAVRQADAVRIRHYGGQAEHVAAHQVGAFAAHAGQLQKVLHGLGHPAVKFVQQHIAHGGKVPRLRAAQAARAHNGLYIVRPAAANASSVGYLANSSSVTIFTRASVHWAASRTLTSSCQALS